MSTTRWIPTTSLRPNTRLSTISPIARSAPLQSFMHTCKLARSRGPMGTHDSGGNPLPTRRGRSTPNQEPSTWNQEPSTQNRAPSTQHREPSTSNQEPRTQRPEPRTNPEPWTLNAEPNRYPRHRLAARSTASMTRKMLPPRILSTSAGAYPFFSSASVIFGSFDASSIPSGIVAPSKSEPSPT